MPSTDSAIPRPLFITFLIIAVVLIAGTSLFFAPALFGSHWPWPLKPFNGRFLGAVYCAEMVAVLFTLIYRSASLVRLSLAQSLVFSVVVTLASVIQLAQFDFSRPLVWVWFIVYVLAIIGFGYYWVRYPVLRAPVSGDSSLSLPARIYILIQGIILGAYGFALFILPSQASAFWPWKIDAFHAQVYSAIFLTGSVGNWLLYRSANRLELTTAGFTQVALAALAILGLVLVDNDIHSVNWSALGTLVWVGAFAWLTLAGLWTAWQARQAS
jgi:hypothetical protein